VLCMGVEPMISAFPYSPELPLNGRAAS